MLDPFADHVPLGARHEKFGPEGLTFDDVLLVPADSDILPSEVVDRDAADAHDPAQRSRWSRRRWTR